MPDRLPPQLASPSTKPPENSDWVHEIKFDGYRTAAHVAGGEVHLITRSGLDWTHRFGDLPRAFKALPCKAAIIDGAIVVLDDRGISRFAALKDALAEGAATTE